MEQIKQQLDKWVAFNGSGKYITNETISASSGFGIFEDVGIQQNRDEILEFAEVLKNMGVNGSILEIGLGYFGSTHFLWRLIFDKVITIEKSHERVRLFGSKLREFSGKWVLNDNKSHFLIGYSYEPETVKKAYGFKLVSVDVLFIDGGHRYEDVLTDYLLYEPLVRKGGIVAFHDVIDPDCGVGKFLKNFEIPIKKIVHSKYLGIGYYVKGG